MVVEMSRRRNQKRHAIKRASQRLGIHLADKGYQELINQIHSGRSRFLENQSNSISIHVVRMVDIDFYAYYNKRTKRIVTIYTDEMMKENTCREEKRQDEMTLTKQLHAYLIAKKKANG